MIGEPNIIFTKEKAILGRYHLHSSSQLNYATANIAHNSPMLCILLETSLMHARKDTFHHILSLEIIIETPAVTEWSDCF